MTSLHVICGLPPHPPIKNTSSAYAEFKKFLCLVIFLFNQSKNKMPEFRKFLCLVIFLFNQSKNNAVLESRTRYFRELEGSRPKPRTSKCVLEAKDVVENSITDIRFGALRNKLIVKNRPSPSPIRILACFL